MLFNLPFLKVFVLLKLFFFYITKFILLHRGKANTIKECILAHFGQNHRYVTIYSCIIWFSQFCMALGFFKMFCFLFETHNLISYFRYYSKHLTYLIGPNMHTYFAVGMLMLTVVVRIFQKKWEKILSLLS